MRHHPFHKGFRDIQRKGSLAGNPFGSSLGHFGQENRLDPSYTFSVGSIMFMLLRVLIGLEFMQPA